MVMLMKRNASFWVLVVFVVAGVFFSGRDLTLAQKAATQTPATPPPAEIEWFSYEAGVAKAQKEGKHLLIDFYTTWCGWCKRMDATTFRDPAVVGAVNKSMVAIKVNAESGREILHNGQKLSERELSGRIFGVSGYPTYWFVDQKGEKLFMLPGYRAAPDFLNLVEYIGGLHYKTVSFPKFLEAKKSGGKSSK